MVFSGLTFIYLFFPAVLLLYFCMPGKVRNLVLLAASLIFYFCGEQLYIFLMLGEIVLTYTAGLLVENAEGKKKKMIISLFAILSFLLLGLFKYADLIPETINTAAGEEVVGLLKLPLPIGISFYVFQSVSYCIDVYRGKYPAERNIIRLALYISFFPQLIAGPIVRFETVSKNLKSRTHSFENLSDGLFRFSVGVGKKVLIADRLYAFCEAAHATGSPSVILAWTESLAFLLYVYFDFSGYSDMAIGLARCFGFELPENFNYPLMSTSFGEFWRRWHISLGTWFRDYLYIPLGGSRSGKARHIRNLLIVWALTGLWHGASWNFVLWGLSFGVVNVFEVLSGCEAASAENKGIDIAQTVLKRLIVTLVTVIFFVWFRFTAFTDALGQFSKMFGSAPVWSRDTGYLLKGAFILLAMAIIGATPLVKTIAEKLAHHEKTQVYVPILKAVIMLVILIFATAYLVDGSFSPFLYFRF